MCHGDGCFGDQFGDDFVFELVGVVVGGLAEPTGGQGDPDAVEAPGTIGITHQGVFDGDGFLTLVVALNDRGDFVDELVGVAKAWDNARGDLAALELVFKADVRFAPVAAETLGDDAVFVDVGPAGVVQQGRNQYEFTVGLRVGIAQSAGVGDGQREVEVVAACPGFGDDLLPDRIEFVGVGGRVNWSGVDRPLGGDGPVGVFVGERRGQVLKCHGGVFLCKVRCCRVVCAVVLGDEGLQHGGHVGCGVGVNVFALGQGLFDGHEVQGRIRAVGGNDLAVAVVEHTEFAAFGVVADHGLVVAVGQPSDLEFDVALIRPEPRDTGVFFGTSHERVGGNFGVLDRVVDRLEPDAFGRGRARDRIGHVGDVAGDDGCAVGGNRVLVDDDAIVDVESQHLGQLGVRDDPDTNQHDLGGEFFTAIESDSFDVAVVVGQDFFNAGFQPNVESALAVGFQEVVTGFITDRATDEFGPVVEHGHVLAELMQGRGSFEPDEPATDDHDVFGVGDEFFQVQGIVGVAEVHDPGQVATRDVNAPRACSDGQRQAAIRVGCARPAVGHTCARVIGVACDVFDALIFDQGDIVVDPVLIGAED